MPADETTRRRKSQAIAAIFGINLVFGMLLVTLYPDLADPGGAQRALEALRGSWFNLCYEVAILVACFLWLGLDSRELGIRRPWWLNLGVVLLTSIFVAYYLYKTRRPGQRGAALFALLGVLFASLLAMLAGMFFALAFQGGGTPPPSGL